MKRIIYITLRSRQFVTMTLYSDPAVSRVLVLYDEAANESWREYQKNVVDSVSDAYEGDSDAFWNTD